MSPLVDWLDQLFLLKILENFSEDMGISSVICAPFLLMHVFIPAPKLLNKMSGSHFFYYNGIMCHIMNVNSTHNGSLSIFAPGFTLSFTDHFMDSKKYKKK